MKSWIVALIALGVGCAISAALIVFTNPDRERVDVYALARSVASGAEVTRDALRLEPVVMPDGIDTLFTPGDEPRLRGVHAAHDLVAGQLLQKTDLAAAPVVADERLVFLPVQEAPPAAVGSRLDLLVVGGTPDRPAVIPFALGVEVRDVVTGGYIVAVPSRQAPAFVYAAATVHLIAVVAAPGASAGNEAPVGAIDQAMALVAQP
jgi:hypothetical protein